MTEPATAATEPTCADGYTPKAPPPPQGHPCGCSMPVGHFVTRQLDNGRTGGYFECERCEGTYFVLMGSP